MLCVHWYHSQILSNTSMSPDQQWQALPVPGLAWTSLLRPQFREGLGRKRQRDESRMCLANPKVFRYLYHFVPSIWRFFLLFCTVAHCCTIVLVLLPNLNCRCFENGNLIHGSHWKLHVSPWCSSSFSLSALLAWHTGKKTFFSCRSLLLFGHVRGFSGRVHQVKHGGNHEISPNKGQVRKHCQKNRWYSSCHRVGIFTIIYLPRPGLL